MDVGKQTEAFEKLQTASLARVIDLLKFAEAKNAALLTFSSAWMLGLISIYANSHPNKFHLTFAIGLLCFGCAALVSMFSFLPKDALEKFHTPIARAPGLLFFGDIAKFDTLEFGDRVQDRYLARGDDLLTREYLGDLSVQISVNSKIVQRKFSLFNWGAFAALLGVLFVFFPLMRIAIAKVT